MRHALTAMALALLSLTVIAVAQNQTLKFEVASVKKLGPASPVPGRTVTTPTRYTATIVGAGIVTQAFQLPALFFVNLDKAPKDFYEINATLPPGATTADVPAMLQNLLIERFHFRYHREVRELKRFELYLAGGANKLKPAAAVPSDTAGTFLIKPGVDGYAEFPPGRDIGPVGFAGRWAMQRVGITVADFVKQLEGTQLDGVVVDRTGLTGKFDIVLKWGTTLRAASADQTNTPEFSEPPLLKAIRDQLGLNVREGKGPAEVIVIDSIDADATPN